MTTNKYAKVETNECKSFFCLYKKKKKKTREKRDTVHVGTNAQV